MEPKIVSGIVPPLVTPLLEGGSLDIEGLERLIEHVLLGGASGLFLLGTTGEGPSLPYLLRREVVQRACLQVAARVPVLVAITDTIPSESLALARFAREHGADAVVLAPPYYFPLAQPELIEYVQDVLAELPLPLVLYNMPSMTKVSFDIATVNRLAEHEKIVGIKDSSGDMSYFHRLLRVAGHARPDWSVLMGSEALLAEAVLAGADGGVCGGANFAPGLFVALDQAARSRDLEAVRALQQQVLALGEGVYSVGQHASAGIKGIKGALCCMGICADGMAAPLRAFGPAERERLRAVLGQIEIHGPALRAA